MFMARDGKSKPKQTGGDSHAAIGQATKTGVSFNRQAENKHLGQRKVEEVMPV